MSMKSMIRKWVFFQGILFHLWKPLGFTFFCNLLQIQEVLLMRRELNIVSMTDFSPLLFFLKPGWSNLFKNTPSTLGGDCYVLVRGQWNVLISHFNVLCMWLLENGNYKEWICYVSDYRRNLLLIGILWIDGLYGWACDAVPSFQIKLSNFNAYILVFFEAF